MLKALFRKIGIFFKNFFTSFLNLFSKKTSSSPALEVQIQQVNTTILDDTEEETQTTLEKIKTILKKTNIALDEKREQLIEKAYNPELLLDGVHVLQDAGLLNDSNLDIILPKIAPWDAARAIVALYNAELTTQIDLAIEKYPSFYRAQIIINLHQAGLTTDLELFNSSNTKELSRPIMTLSRNNLLTQANLGSILDNQGVFLSPNISLLWERFCLSLSNRHPYSLSQEQFDKIISLCQDHKNDKGNSKMTGLERFIRINIFREKMTPQTTTHVSGFFKTHEEKQTTKETLSKRI